MNDYQRLWIELRAIISDRGLKQEDVAKKAGLSQSSISKMLGSARTPPFDHLEQIANALGYQITLTMERKK